MAPTRDLTNARMQGANISMATTREISMATTRDLSIEMKHGYKREFYINIVNNY